LVGHDPFADPHLCPPSLHNWFRRELEGSRPDLALVNYAWWTPLGQILAKMGIPRILEIHDLVTLNARLSEPLQQILGWEPRAAGDVPDAVFAPSPLGLEADAAEYRVLAKWPVISSISAAEAARVASACPGSRVVHVPPAVDLPERTSSLDGAALFPTGPNLFNLQGIHLLASRILPRVLAAHDDFVVDISGHCCASVRQAPGVRPLGFVSDFAGLLSGARFLVSPVRGGTGLQLKVLEGMAAGVPAICLPGPYQEVPVFDGIDGVRAESVEAFADGCARLWSDVTERRRLGEAARAAVAERHSRSAQLGAMRNLVVAAGLEP
jgi:glycosyltransferase involved in cell wall biosynthesis